MSCEVVCEASLQPTLVPRVLFLHAAHGAQPGIRTGLEQPTAVAGGHASSIKPGMHSCLQQ